jgi:hypothetical protein
MADRSRISNTLMFKGYKRGHAYEYVYRKKRKNRTRYYYEDYIRLTETQLEIHEHGKANRYYDIKDIEIINDDICLAKNHSRII